MREFELGTIYRERLYNSEGQWVPTGKYCVQETTDELQRLVGEQWADLIGDRILERAHFIDYGFAEECIGWLQFDDGTHEVGVGECVRGYHQLYAGDSYDAAEETFVSQLKK